MSLRSSQLLTVQTELIAGCTIIFQGIAEASTDPYSRAIAENALDSILLAFTQYNAMLEGTDQTFH